MKSKKKVLVTLLCAVLLVFASVMGTMAYLTKTTEVVTNTFTVGKVELTLDEADVNEYGVAIENAERVMENEYKLIPGHNYIKDPTLHVGEGSEYCYLFVKVVNGLADAEADETIAAQMARLGWSPVAGQDYVFAYKDIASAGDNVTVFEQFTLADDANVEAYKNATITIKGCAVQADGLTKAEAAAQAQF